MKIFHWMKPGPKWWANYFLNIYHWYWRNAIKRKQRLSKFTPLSLEKLSVIQLREQFLCLSLRFTGKLERLFNSQIAKWKRGMVCKFIKLTEKPEWEKLSQVEIWEIQRQRVSVAGIDTRSRMSCKEVWQRITVCPPHHPLLPSETFLYKCISTCSIYICQQLLTSTGDLKIKLSSN